MYPKQFIHFFKGQNGTFLGATLQRLTVEAGFKPPILMCSNDHRFLVAEEVERARIVPRAIVLEPVARNTAPAIAVASLMAARDDAAAIIAVMPSDHVITASARFASAVNRAADIAATGRLVLFGIAPAEPHTGYGYIKRGKSIDGFGDTAFAVEAFVEKPDRAIAEGFYETGEYYWNSGIFVLHVRTFLDELEKLQPETLEAAREALDGASADLGFTRLGKAGFEKAPKISIDYAVMEKTRAAAMLPLDVGWNDVGSWSSLWAIASRDEKGNHVEGDAVLEDTDGCYLHSERSLIATIGVKDLVIVDTPDAVLVADKNRAQDVGRIVARLKQSNRKEQEQHLRNFRPWGYFDTLNFGPRFQVKLLHVKPGGRLSTQMHHHRSEHWVVVQGTAVVTVGDREQLLRENESIYISATQWHRLENPGKVPLEIIEVQIGTYLGEDDIIRKDDIYHRAPEETK